MDRHQEKPPQGAWGQQLPLSRHEGDRNAGTQEPLLSQVCFGGVSAGICFPSFPLLPPAQPWYTSTGAGAPPRTTHMELVNLGKPAVDELFGEVVPLHQEHVDLRG